MRDQIQPNFHRDEFTCQGNDCCGHSGPINPTLVAGLQLLRNNLCKRFERDVVIKILSAFRCKIHNIEIGGAEDSQHPKGNAADICAENVPVCVLYEEALKVYVFANGGIGLYKNRIHVDVRTNGPARWEVL